MKAVYPCLFPAILCLTGLLYAQSPPDLLIEPVEEAVAETLADSLPQPVAQNPAPQPPPAVPATVEPADLPLTPDLPAADNPALVEPTGAPPADAAAGATADPASTFGPLDQQQQEMQRSEEGFIIKDAALNDIFQYLAKSAGRQYFHNAKIAGPDYLVTGHLNDGNPLMQMEELAFMYGLSLHTKGTTIYALTQAQLAQLPSAEFHYQLRYLRPTDMEQIKELIKPMLSPGTGIVNFEPKTNTIIIIDSAHRIEQARTLLHGIDQAKGQIIVETKILRINSKAAERVGINWANSLGADGTPINVIRDLNSVFGLDSPLLDGETGGSSTNLVLTPLQLSGVLRALAEGGIARQVSNPTLITEDNEQATISIIDRVPIITSTTTPGGNGSEPIITEEVRYKIDSSDKTIDTDPESHREIGISLVVTPTLLPDGTVRMRMRPRSAQIVEQIKSITGNTYPRVTESMVESIARVPDGHSLVVGGFYGEAESGDRTKVPLFGDLPVLNFFFKSRESIKEQASLVFVVTPKSYSPTAFGANDRASARLRSAATISCDHDWVNPDNPGPAHEPNMKRTLRGMQPTQAPYYPKPGELQAAPAPAPTRQLRFSKASRR
jgi:type II secretory pathway component GspD/PulD (secretin)